MYSTPAIRSLFLRKGGRILATSPQDSASTGPISTQATKAGSYDVCRVAGSGCASSWPTSGGSPTTSTVIGAIATATDKAMQAVLKAAPKTTNSPFAKTDPKSLKFSQGRVHAADQPPDSGVRFQEILLANNLVGPDGQRIPLRPSPTSAVRAVIALDAKKKKGSH